MASKAKYPKTMLPGKVKLAKGRKGSVKSKKGKVAKTAGQFTKLALSIKSPVSTKLPNPYSGYFSAKKGEKISGIKPAANKKGMKL